MHDRETPKKEDADHPSEQDNASTPILEELDGLKMEWLPSYTRFLDDDLQHFAPGFSFEDVDAVIKKCANVRIAIIRGRLYSQKLSPVTLTCSLHLDIPPSVLTYLQRAETRSP